MVRERAAALGMPAGREYSVPSMDEITVAGIGELLWDCFGDDRRPGGAPANVAFHAAALGASGLLCSRVGCDDAGDALLDHLRRHGLDDRFVQRDKQHPTGRVTVDASRPDSPGYAIDEGVAWDHIAFDGAFVAAPRPPAAICFGTLAQRHPHSRAAIERTLDARTDVLRVFDMNLRPPYPGVDVVASSLSRCDVVKLNEHEVSAVLDMFERPLEGPEMFARWVLRTWPIRLVCVTRGAGGCLLVSENDWSAEGGHVVQGADAVGAGDAFTAALACGILCDWPMPRIARVANEVGAIVASRTGAMPDVRDAYAELLEGN
jgi:fructokinase